MHIFVYFSLPQYFFVHLKFLFVMFDAIKSIKVKEVQEVLNVPKDTKVFKKRIRAPKCKFFSKKLTFHFLHLFAALFPVHIKNFNEQLRSQIVNGMPQAAAGLVATGCLLGN